MTMKTKSIIVCTLLGATLFGMSSCDKMLTTTSSITMTEQEHTWGSEDTVYSVMGIIAKMQQVADRTVLFGELRGDLVQLNKNAEESLNEISNFTAGVDNAYNRPVDYYAIINNCNYYLANADTAFRKNGESIFEREYPVVLSYRAWAYMQLAQIYGKVPFVTEPLTDGAAADLSRFEMLDIREIAVELIPGLLKYAGSFDFPEWGTISENFNSANVFLPVDLVLADLFLWAGGQYAGDLDYKMAAMLLVDYLTWDRKYVGNDRIWWKNEEFLSWDDKYAAAASYGPKAGQIISYIPMHTAEYDGVISYLPDIFCSTENNHNQFRATYSGALANISAAQRFCYALVNTSTRTVGPVMLDPDNKSSLLEKGDLRLNSVVESTVETDIDKLNQSYDVNKQKVIKISPEIIPLYRINTVYLRLAEALNCCGMPETAFAILKYGLCPRNFKDPTIGKIIKYESYISPEELELGDELGLYMFSLDDNFIDLDYTLSTGALKNENCNTIGIHSKGCGDARYDTTYVIAPLDTANAAYREKSDEEKAFYLDSVKQVRMAQVESYLIDELALETCFEGNRFGDLIRFSMHRGDAMGIYTDNDFLATKVSMRTGKPVLGSDLYTRLLGDGISYNPNWYLPF